MYVYIHVYGHLTSHSIRVQGTLCPLAHQMGGAAQGVVIRVRVCLGWSSAGTVSPSAAAKCPLRAPWQLMVFSLAYPT